MLTWPTNDMGYTLETTINLAAPIVWWPVTDVTATLTKVISGFTKM